MATTISYTDALNERSWRAGVTLAAQLQTYSATFEETVDGQADQISPRGGIVVVPRGGKRGTKVTLRFAGVNYDELPKTRMSQVLGQESNTSYFEHSVDIRYFLLDGAIENVPDDQTKVSFDLARGEVDRITRQWAYLLDKWWIYHGTGYTPANTQAGVVENSLSGGNAVVAQDAAHAIFVDGANVNTTAAGVAADDQAVFTTRVLVDGVKRLTSRDYVKWPAAKCDTPWGEYFVCVVGAEGFEQIRQNSSSSDFYDLHKAALQGGSPFVTNPILTGEGFIAGDSVLVLKSDFMPQGVTAGAGQANTRAAMLFGAGAFTKVYGDGYTGSNHFGWSEHKQHRRVSLLMDTIQGINRVIVDSESWSCLAITHYSAKA